MTTINLSEDLRKEMDKLLGQLEKSLTTVIRETDTRIALPPDARAALADLGEPLPESGCGAMAAVERQLDAHANGGGGLLAHGRRGASYCGCVMSWREEGGGMLVSPPRLYVNDCSSADGP